MKLSRSLRPRRSRVSFEHYIHNVLKKSIEMELRALQIQNMELSTLAETRKRAIEQVEGTNKVLRAFISKYRNLINDLLIKEAEVDADSAGHEVNDAKKIKRDSVNKPVATDKVTSSSVLGADARADANDLADGDETENGEYILYALLL